MNLPRYQTSTLLTDRQLHRHLKTIYSGETSMCLKHTNPAYRQAGEMNKTYKHMEAASPLKINLF